MKLKTIFAGAGFVLLSTIILIFLLLPDGNSDEYPWYEVQQGNFEILITVTGELEAENSIRITGPIELQSSNIRLRNVTITDMIAEGSEVEEGDWIATLDRTEAELMLRDLEDELLEAESRFAATRLDTTITLRSLRDELINLEHAIEEARLILGQSAFEPPATIRQAEINILKATSQHQQARDNYVLQKRLADETMTEATLDVQRQRRHLNAMNDLLKKFDITAPQAGMIIYHREWNGTKRMVGSTINSRDLTVAVIPELNSLISRAYVSEIDVNMIRTGQQVRVGLDAFHDRSYAGIVSFVSNVGQEMPNTDAKVFEVLILINQPDYLLRPAMTTSNTIVAGLFEAVNYVPISAVYEHEGIPYVYRNDKTRQIVVTGARNDNFIIIKKGLEQGDIVLLSVPDDENTYKFVGNELIAEIER
jgi:HlyD family secretion protein